MDLVRILVAHHSALINQKVPIKRLPEIVLDDAVRACIPKNGLDFESVPALNQKIDLRPAQSTFWGADPEVVTHMLHPANAEIVLRAVSLFSLSCTGVDFISTNISVPWFENGAVINEVNYAPIIGRTHEYQKLGTRKYMETLFPNKGRVPIEIYVGQQIDQPALQRHRELARAGINAFFCNDRGVLDHLFSFIFFANATDTFKRVEMLRLNADLQHLIIHLENDDSFIRCGLPFEYVTGINFLPPPLEKLTTLQFKTLEFLKQYLQPAT